MSEGLSIDTTSNAVYSGAGQGVFNGFLAAALSHWAWGLNLFICAAVYGYGMSRLRSWAELAGILTMIATTLLYFAIYEVVALDSVGVGVRSGLSVLALALFVVCIFMVAALVDRARVRALKDSDTMALDVERAQHWEERYFARLRAKRAAGERPTPLFIRPLVWIALAFAIAAWLDNRLLVSAVWGVAFFQSVVFGRIAQYNKRLHQPNAQFVLATADRRPILFLRPFALDALPVSPFGDQWYDFLNPYSWLDKRTFEEHLSSTFEDLGPVIAIGRPGEEVALLGAAREYADDATWQDLVLDRAAASQFVIMEVDETPGMVWEIDHVSKNFGLQRILIVLPPGEDLFEKRSVEWNERWSQLQSRFAFLPDVSEDAAAVLFDGDNQPIVVAANESSVPRTLAAIKTAWLEERLRSPIDTAWLEGETDGANPSMKRRREGGTERLETSAVVGEAATRGPPTNFERYLIAARVRLTFAMLRRALLYGRDHPETLRLKRELAIVLLAQGDLAKARKLQEAIVASHRRRGESDDPGTLIALRELATTLRLLGDLPHALATAEQVVETSERVFGEDHPETLRARTELALAMRDRGDLEAARALLERTIERLGVEPTTDRADLRRAKALLASVLTMSGKFEAARALLVRLLEEARERVGDGHPDALEAMSLLAESTAGLGERQEAARLACGALAGYERTLGAEHPVTLKALINAARLSANAGELSEARALGERVLEASRRTLGVDHPDALTALSILGGARLAQGEYEPAHELFMLAWKGRRRVLGETHAHTLAALTNLAGAQLVLGRDEEARSNLERAAESYERTLGSEHPHTLVAMSQLASARAATGDVVGARKLHELVVARARSRLGPRHPDTASMIVALARSVADQREIGLARHLLEEAIDVLVSTVGEEHPSTVKARSEFRALEEEGKPSDAPPASAGTQT
jgi:tetratricopeptide (TPR) repeat protein